MTQTAENIREVEGEIVDAPELTGDLILKGSPEHKEMALKRLFPVDMKKLIKGKTDFEALGEITEENLDQAKKIYRNQIVKVRTGFAKHCDETKAPINGFVSLMNAVIRQSQDAIAQIEGPIKATITAVENEKKRREEEAAQAEKARVDAIKEKILQIEEIPDLMIGKSAEALAAARQKVADLIVDKEGFAEFLPDAAAAKALCLDKLDLMIEQAKAAEEAKALVLRQRASDLISELRAQVMRLIGKGAEDIEKALKSIKAQSTRPLADYGEHATDIQDAFAEVLGQVEIMLKQATPEPAPEPAVAEPIPEQPEVSNEDEDDIEALFGPEVDDIQASLEDDKREIGVFIDKVLDIQPPKLGSARAKEVMEEVYRALNQAADFSNSQ